MKLYKMRILVPAIKMYYKLGAKGGASIDSLLKSDILSQTSSDSLNNVTRIVRFYLFYIFSHLNDVKMQC
jgi:hypothetical protein